MPRPTRIASGQPGTRGRRCCDVRRDRAGLRPGQHGDDGRRRRPLAAGRRPGAAAVASGDAGARCRLRDGQAERRAGRAGRAIRSGRRGGPRPGHDRGGKPRPTATSSSSASRSATPSTCRFAAAEFDAATIAFGLRNLADFEAGFRELARVVRPGGRVVCLELSTPARSAAWGRLFRATFSRLAPLAASAFGHGATYRYLPSSLEGFPDAPALAGDMGRAGLTEVSFRRLALGAVALHVGRVPAIS